MARFSRPALWLWRIFSNFLPKSHLSFPFLQESQRRTKKKDPFYTKTRVTRYLCNQISQNCTKKYQIWLYEIIRFLKIVKFLVLETKKDPFHTKKRGWPGIFEIRFLKIVPTNLKNGFMRWTDPIQSGLNFQTLKFLGPRLTKVSHFSKYTA